MILVIGATGTVGRQVVAQLGERGNVVRAVARDPAGARLPAGVEVVQADLTEPGTLEPYLDGVAAVFLVWPFTSAEMAADLAPRATAVLARRVPRIVFLSASAAAAEPDSSWARVERLIEESGAQWTFLRPTGFASNTLIWADQIRTGTVRWPYGTAVRSLIHERDLAAVAVRAFTEDGHIGKRYLLTGPEAISQAEQVAIIGEATGRAVRWEELTPEEARERLALAWGDRSFADHALASWAEMVSRPEPVTSAVTEITGVAARTFRQWAHDHSGDFRPPATAPPATAPPTTAEVAEEFVTGFRVGDIDAALRLLSPDVVRVAPIEAAAGPGELRGVQAIMESSARLNADVQIHAVQIDDPFVRSDQFAVRFAFDQTHLPTGTCGTAVKMSLYTVAEGLIVREEVYYHTPRRAP